MEHLSSLRHSARKQFMRIWAPDLCFTNSSVTLLLSDLISDRKPLVCVYNKITSGHICHGLTV